jgi:hypothetical protein
MMIAGSRAANGVTVAVLNLKLIWDVITAIHVGRSGDAFVLDHSGRLVAHPDISLVLRGDDDPAAARLKELQRATIAGGGPVASGWSESPGGACTHWKAPPSHGAPPLRSFAQLKSPKLRAPISSVAP